MWRYILARVRGSSHIKSNLPCQDQMACEVLNSDTLLIAISDGAGSASKAERGAEIVVKSVVRYLRDKLDSERPNCIELLRQSACFARKEIFSEAEKEGAFPRDYASTLLAVIITPDGGAAIQIGDGVIVLNYGINEWGWVFWPQRGEYANTTNFLTDDDALNQLETEEISKDVTDVSVMSDGLQALVLNYSNQGVYEPFFNGIFQPIFDAKGGGEIKDLSNSLEKFLSSEKISTKTDDDITLVLATRRINEKSE